MSESQENKHVSIIVCHYGQADDFGEERAKNARPRSEMLKDTMGSLQLHTDYPAEIIVVDNGGNPDDSNYLLDLTRQGVINTYIRNKNNMNFGWAWNQGAKLATGEYICFSCNDIFFEKDWLSTTILPLLKYPDRKYIASPIVTPDKDQPKFYRENVGEYRVNTLAGSNCMLMTKETYEEIGYFTTNPTAGTTWHRTMNKKGYVVVLPPTNKAQHLAHQGGVNFYKKIPVKKELLRGEIIDFSWKQ